MKVSKFLTRFCVILFVLSIIASVYVMINGVGLIDGLNVGSGQYYFTDIPNWKDYFLNDAYKSPFGIPFLTFLFVVWGVIMYKLWVWLDKRL